jgi:DNA-directed RNA polymerase specialized sigma24 family protein
MHIVLLCADGRSPTEIARVLFCSRTTVYAIAARFIREGRAAFDDRKWNTRAGASVCTPCLHGLRRANRLS